MTEVYRGREGGREGEGREGGREETEVSTCCCW